jgi:hypothetical protein
MVSSQWILTWDVNHLLSWSSVKESCIRCNKFILEFKWNPWLESQSEKSRYIFVSRTGLCNPSRWKRLFQLLLAGRIFILAIEQWVDYLELDGIWEHWFLKMGRNFNISQSSGCFSSFEWDFNTWPWIQEFKRGCLSICITRWALFTYIPLCTMLVCF